MVFTTARARIADRHVLRHMSPYRYGRYSTYTFFLLLCDSLRPHGFGSACSLHAVGSSGTNPNQSTAVASKNDYIKRLEKAIHELHGTAALYLCTDSVRETLQGRTVWEGEVEVFSITGHLKAPLCYAWSYQDGNKEHFATVLQIAPIRTAADAVRAYIVADVRKRKAN